MIKELSPELIGCLITILTIHLGFNSKQAYRMTLNNRQMANGNL